MNRFREERNALYKSARWKKLRRKILGEQPWCADCLKRNRLVRATIIDHSLGHRDAQWRVRFFDERYLISRCKSCHDRKTAYEVQFAGHNRSVEIPAERECDESGEPLDPNHPWNRE